MSNNKNIKDLQDEFKKVVEALSSKLEGIEPLRQEFYIIRSEIFKLYSKEYQEKHPDDKNWFRNKEYDEGYNQLDTLLDDICCNSSLFGNMASIGWRSSNLYCPEW